MSQTINVPGVGMLSFPDGMSDDDMAKAIQTNYPQIHGATADAPNVVGKDSPMRGAKQLGGVLETAAQMGSSALAVPASGINALGTMATNALGITDKDPSQTIQETQNALTYQPRTAAGQAMSGAVGRATAPIARGIDQLGQSASDATGSPAYGAATAALTTALPDILGLEIPGLGKASAARTMQGAIDTSGVQAAVQNAKDLGYHLTPQQGNGGVVGSLLEAPAGKVKLQQALSQYNQNVTNTTVKADVGLPANVPLNPTTRAALKASSNAVYKQVEGSDATFMIKKDAQGNPLRNANGKLVVAPAGPVDLTGDAYQEGILNIGKDRNNEAFGSSIDPAVQKLQEVLQAPESASPKDVLAQVSVLRSDARANIKAEDDPAKLSLGRAQMQGANLLEDQLANHLQQSGQMNLYNSFTLARTKLAKLHAIDYATNEGTGDVSAQALAQYRNAGNFLGGNLEKIANVADSFKKSTQDPSKFGGVSPFDSTDYTMAALSAGIGGSEAGAGHIALGGALGAAIATARPLSRAFLNSPFYQQFLQAKTPKPGMIAQGASNPAIAGGAALMATPDGSQGGQ